MCFVDILSHFRKIWLKYIAKPVLLDTVNEVNQYFYFYQRVVCPSILLLLEYMMFATCNLKYRSKCEKCVSAHPLVWPQEVPLAQRWASPSAQAQAHCIHSRPVGLVVGRSAVKGNGWRVKGQRTWKKQWNCSCVSAVCRSHRRAHLQSAARERL